MDPATRDAAIVEHLKARYSWRTTIATQCVLRDDFVRDVREAVGPGFSIFDITRYVRRAFPGYPENGSAIRVTRVGGLNHIYVNNIRLKSADEDMPEGLMPEPAIPAIPKPVCNVEPHSETKEFSRRLVVEYNWQNAAPGILAVSNSVSPRPREVAFAPVYDKNKPIANVSAFKLATKPITAETQVYEFNFDYPPDVYQMIGMDTWVNANGDLWEENMNDNFVWFNGMEIEEAGPSNPVNVEVIDLTED